MSTNSSGISDYRGYALVGLALDVRDQLDPEIFNAIYYGIPSGYQYPQTNDAADELIDLLTQIRDSKRRREAAQSGTTGV